MRHVQVSVTAGPVKVVQELDKPGRDPRARFEEVRFKEGVNGIKDLREGMSLPGVITNITKFGAFVDVGVHQDGLVHISHLTHSFVSDPTQVVKLGQKVQVRVLEVDVPRKRISLSMKEEIPETIQKRKSNKPAPKNDVALQDKLAELKGKWRR